MFHPWLDKLTSADLYMAREIMMYKGYWHFHKFITSTTIELFEHEIENLESNPNSDKTYGQHFNKFGDTVAMDRIDKQSDLFFDFARHPRVMMLAAHFLGKPAIPLQVGYISKPARDNQATLAHQDHAMYQGHFPNELAITFWISLDDTNADGGALEYVESSPFSMNLLPHLIDSSSNHPALTDSTKFDFTPVNVKKGGCIIHHSFAVHRASKNQSDLNNRRAILLKYRGSSYQAKLQQEINHES
jgi:ectoine hydroxylase-related dioxygenase (phytanoyl-CoA dioxygenase family)